jgi:uncharacterized integral membrane protein (TIGR00697 family)
MSLSNQENTLDEVRIEKAIRQRVTDSKSNRLFFILGGFFLVNAFIAEFIGVKIFALEDTLQLAPWGLNPSGAGPLNFTAGVLLWPVVFIITDVINDYFGVKGVKFLSYLTVALIAYAFIMVFLAIGLAPADWWDVAYQDKGVPQMQAAFSSVFGQGLWIIIGSLVAFLVGQVLDAVLFKHIKKLTGQKHIWLRATVSTLFSQLIDSYLVLYIAFVLGADWTMDTLLSVGTANYLYKITIAILFIPLLYLIHSGIQAYLGKEVAEELKELALKED